MTPVAPVFNQGGSIVWITALSSALGSRCGLSWRGSDWLLKALAISRQA